MSIDNFLPHFLHLQKADNNVVRISSRTMSQKELPEALLRAGLKHQLITPHCSPSGQGVKAYKPHSAVTKPGAEEFTFCQRPRGSQCQQWDQDSRDTTCKLCLATLLSGHITDLVHQLVSSGETQKSSFAWLHGFKTCKLLYQHRDSFGAVFN